MGTNVQSEDGLAAEIESVLRDPLLPLIAIVLRMSDSNFRYAATLIRGDALSTLKSVERVSERLAAPAPKALFKHSHKHDVTIGDIYAWHMGLHHLYKTRSHVRLSDLRLLLRDEFRWPIPKDPE